MKKSTIRRRLSSPPCDELREDDGIDPRYMQKKNYYKDKRNFQNIRLCNQISKVLSLLFAGGCSDERFNGLGVESVIPEPDMSCLRIIVFPLYNDPETDPERIIQFLDSAKSYLRQEVATAINRKRMPDFRFRVVVDPEKFII